MRHPCGFFEGAPAIAPRILIADDNPLSLRFLVDALASKGVDCGEAVDGPSALRSATERAFDLLLLDARMPGLDGAEVLARVRGGNGPSRHAVALATTAAHDADAIATLQSAGFGEVLLKPIGIDALHAAIARHLPAHAMAMPASSSVDTLDDAQAQRAAGGDAAIVAALRGLFVSELDILPAEIATISTYRDAAALRDRLHRLDASAGFCGVPSLVRAAAILRSQLEGAAWPDQGVADFLAASARARALLSV